jgi:serine/threonine-protein kinase
LIHTNIVQTYHLAEDRGSWFICMEYIRGVNLDEMMTRLQLSGRALPPELAVFIVSRIARGLAYAHSKTDPEGRPLGIVHRDISPKNIMLAFEGDVKVTDFGIAKARGFLTDKEGEEVAGKPEYMSPEQADFKITDKRSDLFSAGVVLSQLLTGQNLFRADTPEASRERVLSTPIPDFQELCPTIEPRLNQILQRALHRDLALRYQSADEFLYELEHFIYHRGYGPTNETMGRFLRQVYDTSPTAPPPSSPPVTERRSAAGKTVRTPAAPAAEKTKSMTRTQSRTQTQTRAQTRKVAKPQSLVERIKSRLK